MSHQPATPIKLIVIGHTNVGKTSLMRTLLRDGEFGEVKNASATTRHVEAVTLYANDGKPLVALYDTPGLEDGSGVMDFLHEHTDGRADGVERLQAFLRAVASSDPKLSDDYSQEAKVINALLSADVAIYVVDVREPVLSKYKDELAILASSGVPVLPVFNFIKDERANFDDWRETLTRRALHAYQPFDTIAFDFASEMALWDNLGTLTHHPAFATLKHERTELWQDMAEMGSLVIADFLVNVASFHKKIGEDDDPTPTLTTMQHATRQAFDIMQQKLLDLYKFYHVQTEHGEFAVTGAEQDIFDSELLARYGIRTASGSMAGMIVGAGIDVATLGASLGLGTAIGGVLGGLLPNSGTIKDKAMGVKTLTINNETLALLAIQSQNLHYTLRHLGHASLDIISTHHHDTLVWQAGKLPTPLKKARAYPHYSSLDGRYDDKKAVRSELSDKLSDILLTHLGDMEKSR
ncbi:Predicted GTPase [Moraxella lacunata]|uniref:Predicted GTPase n=1 Tax=Moraxella lacunata TaxID=477 RepID=A0A378TTD9_MORLA|nr:DUF3482 domain-containing protein [Moraxella lacunata]STZ63997.1 Predicted GTPase [Moraxella lacunata]